MPFIALQTAIGMLIIANMIQYKKEWQESGSISLTRYAFKWKHLKQNIVVDNHFLLYFTELDPMFFLVWVRRACCSISDGLELVRSIPMVENHRILKAGLHFFWVFLFF